MYTRAYPPRTTPIPQNYGGIALREAEEPPVDTPAEEMHASPLNEAAEAMSVPTQDSAEQDNEASTEPETVAAYAPQEERCEPKKLPASLPSADLLLIALAVLLLQGEKQDNELLIALLFLLLYN